MDQFDFSDPPHVQHAIQQINAELQSTRQHAAALQQQFLDLTAAARQVQAPHSTTSAPKLPLPEKFEGKRNMNRQFINSVKLHFKMQQNRFTTPQSEGGSWRPF